MKRVVIKLIRIYQRSFSPLLGSHCRFYPSCSDYFILALKEYGFLKGLFLGLKRILKCGPWSRGGIDLP